MFLLLTFFVNYITLFLVRVAYVRIKFTAHVYYVYWLHSKVSHHMHDIAVFPYIEVSVNLWLQG